MCKSLSGYSNLPLQLQREQKMGLFAIFIMLLDSMALRDTT